jgi:transcriptional regulator with XRE-family HTH domain
MKKSWNKKLGEKIKELRKSRGISQMELAENLGISYQQIQKYEKGKSSLSAYRLYQIASFLNIPISFFFEEEKDLISENKEKYEILPSLNKEEKNLLKKFRKIKNRKIHQIIIKLLEAIVEVEEKKTF